LPDHDPNASNKRVDPADLLRSADALLAAAVDAIPDGAEWLERARRGMHGGSDKVSEDWWRNST